MKNRSLLLAAGVLAASFALPAAAQSSLYVGGSLGRAHYTDVCGGSADCKDRDTQFGLFAGWQFNRFIALEAGFRDFGHATVGGANVKANALELDAVGSLHIYRGFSLLGRVGGFHGTMKGPSANQRKNGLTVGWGGQYDFSQAFGTRLEWQRYANLGGGDFGAETNIDTLSLGALFRF